jgi:hypothetical protein
MLTPRPDFGKATGSPCGHSGRARHLGRSPYRHYAIARLNRNCTGVEAIASGEHTSGRMEARGTIGVASAYFGGKKWQQSLQSLSGYWWVF